MKVFFERLKYEREQKEITQQQMADKLKITRSAYSHYEQYKHGRQPSYEILVEIAKILEVRTDYLLGLED